MVLLPGLRICPATLDLDDLEHSLILCIERHTEKLGCGGAGFVRPTESDLRGWAGFSVVVLESHDISNLSVAHPLGYLIVGG